MEVTWTLIMISVPTIVLSGQLLYKILYKWENNVKYYSMYFISFWLIDKITVRVIFDDRSGMYKVIFTRSKACMYDEHCRQLQKFMVFFQKTFLSKFIQVSWSIGLPLDPSHPFVWSEKKNIFEFLFSLLVFTA